MENMRHKEKDETKARDFCPYDMQDKCQRFYFLEWQNGEYEQLG